MATFSELKAQLEEKKTTGIGVQRERKTFSKLKEEMAQADSPKYTFKDPASGNWLGDFARIMFREPMELGKTIAMTPDMINRFEETQKMNDTLLATAQQKYKSGEMGIDTYEKIVSPLLQEEEVPTGITKTTEQIIGDVAGTLLWATPASELKALKGISTLSRLKRGMALGGAFGTAYGLSEGAPTEEVLKRAGMGAAFGGPLEVLGPLAFKGVGKALSKTGSVIAQGAEKISPAWEWLAPVAYRLEKMGPAGKRIVESLHYIDDKFASKAGARMRALEEAGYNKLTTREAYTIVDALEGRIQPSTLNEKLLKTYEAMDKIRQEMATDAKKAIPEFKTRKNFYPHESYDINILGKKGGKIREELLENSVRIGKFKTKEEAGVALNSYIEFIETGGREGKYWLDWLVKSGQAADRQAAKRATTEMLEGMGLWARKGKPPRSAKYGHLDYPRQIDFPFYDPDVRRTFPMYILEGTRRLESAAELGPAGQELNKMVGETVLELQRTGRLADAVEVGTLVDKAVGAIKVAPKMQQISLLMRAIQIPKLGFAQILNIGQSMNTLLATDLPSLAKGIRLAFTKEGQLRALESGATLESVMRETRRLVGGETGFADWFLKWTGFSWTEKFNRTVSANAGMNYALRLRRALISEPANEILTRQITELGLNPSEIIKRELTRDEMMRAGKIIADNTQFRARPLDLPAFASSPEGKLLFQFKNFAYNQTLFLKRQLIDEFAKGNPGRATRNLIILSTVFPMTGEVLGDLRSLLTGSTRPTNYLTRYFENIAMVGGMGIWADVLTSARYGAISDLMVGPTFGTAAAVIERLTKVVETGEITDSDLRWLGQQGGITRTITNYLFPVENPNRQKILDAIK